MTEASPLVDTISKLRDSLKVKLVEPDFNNRDQLGVLQRLDIESAEEGQLGFETLKPIPMGKKGAERWAKGKFGDFKYVSRILYDKNERIIGEVSEYTDTHIDQVNELLEQQNTSFRLYPTTHREVSTFTLKHTNNRTLMDEQASLLQVIEIFNLDGMNPSENPLETVAMYIDTVDESDREMARRLGFTTEVGPITYEDGPPPQAFIATRSSVAHAVLVYAANLGIGNSAQVDVR